MTLYTRGKKAITEQIADDTDYGYQQFARSVRHIQGDRKVTHGYVIDASQLSLTRLLQQVQHLLQHEAWCQTHLPEPDGALTDNIKLDQHRHTDVYHSPALAQRSACADHPWLQSIKQSMLTPEPSTLDLQDYDDVRRKLSGSGFQVVFDINGREAEEAEPLLDGLAGRGGSLEQYIYCSSAGVYLKSDMMPHREEDAVDPKSRHKVSVCAFVLDPRRVHRKRL